MKIIYFLFLFCSFRVVAQTQGGVSHSREIPTSTPSGHSWWNLLHYDISITPDYKTKTISGINSMRFAALRSESILRIDLQEPMIITRVEWKQQDISFHRENDYYELIFPNDIETGQVMDLDIYFEGRPTEAINAPYDSGWIWEKDNKGRPWMTVACQGSGASIWLPCKDLLYDEPEEGVSFTITIPDTLAAVANGRLQSRKTGHKGMVSYTWKVDNPINNYNIISYIGKYVTWGQDYKGIKGTLNCDYWVLDYNLQKARVHLQQADTMLAAFEYWLGPYPFYNDGYKVVEAPFPGMEHQSAIAYGNGFQNGFRGKDFISNTGWGLKWDFMLVHESGHEWFGNSITCDNYGDTWIHEGFTKYLETLYTDFVFGKNAGNEYALGTWTRIKHDKPILGTGTSDKYYKGSAMLHTIRQILGDSLFRGWLHGLNQDFFHQTIHTDQVLRHLNAYSNRDFSTVFEQYLETTLVPMLEYFISAGELHYRWTNCVKGFNMPIRISLGQGAFRWIMPGTDWQKLSLNEKPASIILDKNFYAGVMGR